MTKVATTIQVSGDGVISGKAPSGVKPGEHRIELDSETVQRPRMKFSEIPVDDCGPWPPGFTFRREDIYGDDGR
jgi:hypothetical protein